MAGSVSEKEREKNLLLDPAFLLFGGNLSTKQFESDLLPSAG